MAKTLASRIVVMQRGTVRCCQRGSTASACEESAQTRWGSKMEKWLRCTVCTWRGSWQEAESRGFVPPSPVSATFEEIERAIDEHMAWNVRLGADRRPRCPRCGHHTAAVKLHSGHIAV